MNFEKQFSPESASILQASIKALETNFKMLLREYAGVHGGVGPDGNLIAQVEALYLDHNKSHSIDLLELAKKTLTENEFSNLEPPPILRCLLDSLNEHIALAEESKLYLYQRNIHVQRLPKTDGIHGYIEYATKNGHAEVRQQLETNLKTMLYDIKIGRGKTKAERAINHLKNNQPTVLLTVLAFYSGAIAIILSSLKMIYSFFNY